MQVAHEVQSTKSTYKCGYFCVKNFINQRNDVNVCGVAAIFPAITMSGFTITTEIIRKRKMTRYCIWMNDLESYSSFARKLLSSGILKGKLT